MSRRPGSTRQRLDRLFAPSRASRAPDAGGGPASGPGNESLRRLESDLLGAGAADGGLSLKERLERLVAATRERPPVRQPASPTRVAGPPPELDEVLHGEECANEHGAYYEVTQVFPLQHLHGRVPLSRVPELPPEAFSMLARGDDASGVDLERALFFDTETTGLAGGSGTCPFLVGLGYVDGDAFVVRQLFLRDYHEEPALLAALSEALARFDVLVSYNGKNL